MRTRALVILLVLALVPVASAAGYDFTAGKSFAQVTSASPTVFEVPFHANEDGFVYAKLLGTPGNAVNDGYTANGSAAAKTGWWVEFALLHANGTRTELGAFSDGTPSPLEPIANGEDAKLIVGVHWPPAAAQPNADDRVYGALAFRLNPAGTSAGENSGGTLDMARSFNVELRFPSTAATLPDGTPVVTPTPTTTVPPTLTNGSAPPPVSPTPSPATPPVSAIPTSATPAPSGNSGNGQTTIIVQASVPSWFLAIVAIEGAAIVLLAVGFCVLLLRVLRREPVPRAPVAARTIPVSEPAASAREAVEERPSREAR